MYLFNKLRALRGNLQFDNWLLTVLQRLLFRHERLVVYRKGSVTFLVDFRGDDPNGTRLCFVSDMYSRWFSHFPRQRPLAVLDLGANGGGFSLSLIASGFVLSKCVSVEMNPNTHTRLQFNLGYNCRDHCRALNAAVAAKSGWVDLADTPGGTCESLYSLVESPEQARVRVPLMTFDEIVSAHFGNEMIDVCKMDVEGAEYEVFYSETCQAIKRVRFLIIEIHKRPDVLDLMERIAACGFTEIVDKNRLNGEVHLFKNKHPVSPSDERNS